MTTLAQDTCIRADQSGLGTASDGSSYTVNGTVTTAIASNEAKITAANGFPSVFLSSNTTADINVLVRVQQINNSFDGIGPCFRCVDGNNMYFVALYAGSGGLVFAKLVSGGFTSLATGAFTLNAATYYQVRVIMAGNHLQARIWADGSSEPGTWIIDTTDATYSSAGRFGMSFNTYGGNGTLFDHITVTDNQSGPTITTYASEDDLSVADSFLALGIDLPVESASLSDSSLVNGILSTAEALSVLDSFQVLATASWTDSTPLSDSFVYIDLQLMPSTDLLSLSDSFQAIGVSLPVESLTAADSFLAIDKATWSDLLSANDSFASTVIQPAQVTIPPYVIIVTFRDGRTQVTFRDGVVQIGGH